MFNKEKMCAYNQELMDNFETYLSYEPYSPATVKHYVDDTRMFLKWLWHFNKISLLRSVQVKTSITLLNI